MWYYAHKKMFSSQQYMTMCMIRNQIFYGKGTFQKSKSISDMESHVFLKANKNQLPLYTYYYTISDFCLTKYRNFLTQKW
jgi:hypothetical protein